MQNKLFHFILFDYCLVKAELFSFGVIFSEKNITLNWCYFLLFQEVVLINDTIQMERFETVPFALRFSVRLFNLTNPDAVMVGGVPVLEEVGPYVYQ